MGLHNGPPPHVHNPVVYPEASTSPTCAHASAPQSQPTPTSTRPRSSTPVLPHRAQSALAGPGRMWTLMSSLPVTLEPEIGSANRPSKGFFPVKKNHQQPRQVNALTVAHHKPSVPDHTLHEFVHTLSVTDHALTLADQYQFCLYNLCRGQVGQLHLSQGQDHGGGEGQYPQGTGTLLPIPSDINHLIGQNQASWGFSEI